MKKIIHIIPFDAPGGVETAALSMRNSGTPDFTFILKVLFPGPLTPINKTKSFSPFAYILRSIQVMMQRPDAIIVSLWRAAIIGVICKIFHPRLKLVVFLHCSQRMHVVDRWVTMLANYLASEIWCDSEITLRSTVSDREMPKAYVISFVPQRQFQPVTNINPMAKFIYFGRLAKQKNLRRAIRIFAAVREKISEAKFAIIGPDGGEGALLRQLCVELGVHDCVSFIGPIGHNELPKFARAASFFLFTSEFEGFGLALVEAMQMGLVPVTTMVGDAAQACSDNVNAIVIRRDECVADRIAEIIRYPEIYKCLRSAAIETWSNKNSYRDDVISGCYRVLKLENMT